MPHKSSGNNMVSNLNKQIKSLEALNAGIGTHVVALEKLVRQRRTVMTRRMTEGELHSAQLELADKKALQSVITTHIDALKAFVRHLEQRGNNK